MFFSYIVELFTKLFGLFGYISQDRLYPEPLSKTEEEMYLFRKKENPILLTDISVN